MGIIMRVRISWNEDSVISVLNDKPTAKAVWDALPQEGEVQLWGDEAFFSFPLDVELEADAQQTVDAGTLCYWVEGQKFALPFGPTPMSQDERPTLVAPCNIIGQLEEDPEKLRQLEDGKTVRVEKTDG